MRLFTLIFLMLIGTTAGFSQPEMQDTSKAYLGQEVNEIQRLYHSNLDSAIGRGMALIKKSESLNDTSWLITAYSALAGAYFYQGDINTTTEKLRYAIDLSKAAGLTKGTPGLLNNLALIQYSNFEFSKAISSAKEAYELALEIRDTAVILSSSSTLANTYVSTTGNTKKGNEIYRAAEKFINDRARPQTLNSIYSGIAGTAWILDSLDVAVEYYGKAYQISTENGMERLAKEVELNLLNLAINTKTKPLKEIEQSILNFYPSTKNKKYGDLTADFSHLIISYIDAIGGLDAYQNSRVYKRLGFELSELVESLKRSPSKLGPSIYSNCLSVAAQMHGERGDYSEQAYYLNELVQVQDSIFKDQLALELAQFDKEILEVNQKYELVKRDLELAALTEQNRIAKLDRLRLMLWGAIATFLAILFIIQMRNQKRRSNQERQYLENEKMLKDLQIEKKNQELSHLALSTKMQNELLKDLKSDLGSSKDPSSETKKLLRKLKAKSRRLQQMNLFFEKFREMEQSLIKKLEDQFPSLTQNDIKLIALIHAQLNNADIGQVLGIEERSVTQKKYRLKKKLELSTDDSLYAFLRRFNKQEPSV